MARRPQFTNRGRLNRRFEVMRTIPREDVSRALLRGGLLIQGHAQQSIQEQTPGGKPYRSRGRKGAIHFASPDGSPPNADTGELHTSITTTFTGTENLTVEIGANTPYATHLELGTVNMEPRPYMSPAFRANVERIEQMIRRAIQNAIRRAGR